MLDSAPVATPMTHTSHLSPDQGTPLNVVVTSQYRRLLDRLIYLTNTHPDIDFAVHNLVQYHQQVSRLLRYLKGKTGDGLYFVQNNTYQLCGFNVSN